MNSWKALVLFVVWPVLAYPCASKLAHRGVRSFDPYWPKEFGIQTTTTTNLLSALGEEAGRWTEEIEVATTKFLKGGSLSIDFEALEDASRLPQKIVVDVVTRYLRESVHGIRTGFRTVAETAEEVVLATHLPKSMQKAALIEAERSSALTNFPTIFLVGPTQGISRGVSQSKHFVRYSSDGELDFYLPRLKRARLWGGYLDSCLLHTLKDVVVSTQEKEVKFSIDANLTYGFADRVLSKFIKNSTMLRQILLENELDLPRGLELSQLQARYWNFFVREVEAVFPAGAKCTHQPTEADFPWVQCNTASGKSFEIGFH